MFCMVVLDDVEKQRNLRRDRLFIATGFFIGLMYTMDKEAML